MVEIEPRSSEDGFLSLLFEQAGPARLDAVVLRLLEAAAVARGVWSTALGRLDASAGLGRVATWRHYARADAAPSGPLGCRLDGAKLLEAVRSLAPSSVKGHGSAGRHRRAVPTVRANGFVPRGIEAMQVAVRRGRRPRWLRYFAACLVPARSRHPPTPSIRPAAGAQTGDQGSRAMSVDACVSDALRSAPVLAVVTAVTAVTTAIIGITTLRRSLLWKRSELASNFLKELGQYQELSFACRCLDWNAGTFVVPDSMCPLLPGDARTIEHDPEALATAMRVDLTVAEMRKDPRLQIYRTAIDSLLSWLAVVSTSIDRDLFGAEDLPGVGYWVDRITAGKEFTGSLNGFGYADPVRRLSEAFDRSTRRDRLLRKLAHPAPMPR